MPSAAASEDTNNVEGRSASNRSPSEAETSKTAEMTSGTPAVLTLPLYLSWFMHHTYGKEIKQIEQHHGVSIGAEVSVSINPTESSRSDSVFNAYEDFQKLVQGFVNSFSEAAINHNQMDSDTVKQALLHIQSEEAKMMFTMSATLEELKKHTPISLRFRDKYGNSKDMTAQIYPDEACSVTAAQKSRLKENGALSSKVMDSMPVIGSFSEADIYHNQMDSDIVKPALPHIQSKDSRMMFTMSASNPFFGPKNFTDMIKRGVEDTRMGRQFNDKSIQRNKNNDLPPQSRSSLNMDTKDLPAELEMDTVHWDLMKLSYKKQLSQLETKYGVSFHEDKLQNNGTIKVQALSKGDQRVNLESHATRALSHLYQKLGSAAVTCELKYPSDATLVASEVEKLQQQHHPVFAEDVLSRWRLVGLPEHLGPAIADIEKIFKRSVFDDEQKKWIGYSGDIPHARGIKLNQTK
ncbi:uncharacterized protein [Pseudorasbora parva]|uniref:uncharacterized protein n=1 Tax=Pseudorasbora parva TaxID=51549 RepID=UPI00351F663E